MFTKLRNTYHNASQWAHHHTAVFVLGFTLCAGLFGSLRGSVQTFAAQNPFNPEVVASINGLINPKEPVIDGNYMYIANGVDFQNQYVSIFDISNPSSPSHIEDIFVYELMEKPSIYQGYMYTPVSGAIHITDLSNTSNTGFILQNQFGGQPRFSGNYMYVIGKESNGSVYSGTFSVVDITNPLNPTVAQAEFPSVNVPTLSPEAINDNYAVAFSDYGYGDAFDQGIGGWGGAGGYTKNGSVYVYNISDKANPYLDQMMTLDEDPIEVINKDNYIYVANGSSVRLFDISGYSGVLYTVGDMNISPIGWNIKNIMVDSNHVQNNNSVHGAYNHSCPSLGYRTIYGGGFPYPITINECNGSINQATMHEDYIYSVLSDGKISVKGAYTFNDIAIINLSHNDGYYTKPVFTDNGYAYIANGSNNSVEIINLYSEIEVIPFDPSQVTFAKTIPGSTGLQVSAEVTPEFEGPFTVGTRIPYTITLQNSGNQTLENIWIKDFLPANMIFAGADNIEYTDEEVEYGVVGDTCYTDLLNNQGHYRDTLNQQAMDKDGISFIEQFNNSERFDQIDNDSEIGARFAENYGLRYGFDFGTFKDAVKNMSKDLFDICGKRTQLDEPYYTIARGENLSPNESRSRTVYAYIITPFADEETVTNTATLSYQIATGPKTYETYTDITTHSETYVPSNPYCQPTYEIAAQPRFQVLDIQREETQGGYGTETKITVTLQDVSTGSKITNQNHRSVENGNRSYFDEDNGRYDSNIYNKNTVQLEYTIWPHMSGNIDVSEKIVLQRYYQTAAGGLQVYSPGPSGNNRTVSVVGQLYCGPATQGACAVIMPGNDYIIQGSTGIQVTENAKIYVEGVSGLMEFPEQYNDFIRIRSLNDGGILLFQLPEFTGNNKTSTFNIFPGLANMVANYELQTNPDLGSTTIATQQTAFAYNENCPLCNPNQTPVDTYSKILAAPFVISSVSSELSVQEQQGGEDRLSITFDSNAIGQDISSYKWKFNIMKSDEDLVLNGQADPTKPSGYIYNPNDYGYGRHHGEEMTVYVRPGTETSLLGHVEHEVCKNIAIENNNQSNQDGGLVLLAPAQEPEQEEICASASYLLTKTDDGVALFQVQYTIQDTNNGLINLQDTSSIQHFAFNGTAVQYLSITTDPVLVGLQKGFANFIVNEGIPTILSASPITTGVNITGSITGYDILSRVALLSYDDDYIQDSIFKPYKTPQLIESSILEQTTVCIDNPEDNNGTGGNNNGTGNNQNTPTTQSGQVFTTPTQIITVPNIPGAREVIIGGVPATQNPDGTWSATIELNNGQNDLPIIYLGIGEETIKQDALRVVYNPQITPPTNPGPGGGKPDLRTDEQAGICEIRDCSDGYYDRECGVCDKEHNAANDEEQPFLIDNPIEFMKQVGSVMKSMTCDITDELVKGYVFSYDLGITTVDDICKADVRGPVIRKHLAKFLSVFAVKVLDMKPDTTRVCEFADMSKESFEMQGFARMACQLGIMGLKQDGTPDTVFNPNQIVNRAIFGTALSRLIYRGENNSTTGIWYQKHLNALQKDEIMTQINNPMAEEMRGYVMLMLMRAHQFLQK